VYLVLKQSKATETFQWCLFTRATRRVRSRCFATQRPSYGLHCIKPSNI